MDKSTALPALFSEQSPEGKFLFAVPLLEAEILDRPNRFIVVVRFPDGTEAEAHCPTTGGIGGWEISGLKCLVSGPHLGNRRTRFGLEALEVPMEDGSTMMVGINQGAANRYVEASLLSGQFLEAVGPIRELKREKKLGTARIDFNVDDEEFIEVKTPLNRIDLKTLVPPKASGYASSGNPTSVERLIKHVRELTTALNGGQKAILLTCFIYDAPPFNPPKLKVYSETFEALETARLAGLERWQVNYSIDREGITFQKLQKFGEES